MHCEKGSQGGVLDLVIVDVPIEAHHHRLHPGIDLQRAAWAHIRLC
eukprot:COSAG04_NODE_12643_length_642_cov_0.948435_2_plen_45_part_01